MEKLDETGLTPADTGFYPEARAAVIDMGIVRRRKVDVAADLPDKRIADLPVELDDELGRSIRQAERELGARLAERTAALEAARHRGVKARARRRRTSDIIRAVAHAELEESKAASTGEKRLHHGAQDRPGQGRGSPRTTPRSWPRSVGKVVFFAKHIDVMDAAEEHLRQAGPAHRLAARRPERRWPARPRSTRSTTTPRSPSRSARSPPPASA